MYRLWGRIDRRLERWGSNPNVVEVMPLLLWGWFWLASMVLANPDVWTP